MATVSVKFDTVTKKMSCDIDGKELSNVCYVSLGQSYDGDGDEFSCSISMSEKDDEHDLRTYTNLTASESTEGKQAILQARASENPTFPGFVAAKEEVNKVTQHIHDFLASK